MNRQQSATVSQSVQGFFARFVLKKIKKNQQETNKTITNNTQNARARARTHTHTRTARTHTHTHLNSDRNTKQYLVIYNGFCLHDEVLSVLETCKTETGGVREMLETAIP